MKQPKALQNADTMWYRAKTCSEVFGTTVTDWPDKLWTTRGNELKEQIQHLWNFLKIISMNRHSNWNKTIWLKRSSKHRSEIWIQNGRVDVTNTWNCKALSELLRSRKGQNTWEIRSWRDQYIERHRKYREMKTMKTVWNWKPKLQGEWLWETKEKYANALWGRNRRIISIKSLLLRLRAWADVTTDERLVA